ncbi:DUF2306 domain-containing protein [Leisingera sp. S232]|uniref:DUF2306 domain-containing protein n=1 Tax=Leisingera sp. S232 TaxID=3415132 RepID=UPI003C7AA8E2
MTFLQASVPTVFLYILCWPVLRDSIHRLWFLSLPHETLNYVDQRYADHPISSAVHLLPGLVFFLIGPLQFHARLRRYRRLHRVLGYVFVVAGLFSSVGVMHMVLVFPALGGFLTQVVTYVLCLGMSGMMILAVLKIRQRDMQTHQRLMRLAFAIGMSVSTARYFIHAADTVFGVPFEQSFSVASALGVIVNLAVATTYEVFRSKGKIGWNILGRGRKGKS